MAYAPLGVPVPLSRDVVSVTEVAAVVVATGGSGVVNVTTLPTDFATAFCAIAQR